MANAGASCPLFYPIDSRALEGLEYLPPFPLPPGVPGLRPPSGTSPPCPLGAWPTSQGDTLRLSILVTGGPKTVNFYGRTQSVTGDYVPFSRTVTGNSPTTPATATLPMPSGCLMNADAIAVGGIGAATIYVLAELGHVEGGTFVPYAQVLSGLLTGYGVASSVATAGSGGGSGGACCIGDAILDFPDPLTGDYAYQGTYTVAAGTATRVRTIRYSAYPGSGGAAQRIFIRIYTVADGWDQYYYLSPTDIPDIPDAGVSAFIGGIEANPEAGFWYTSLPDTWITEDFIAEVGMQFGNTDALNSFGYFVLETVNI